MPGIEDTPKPVKLRAIAYMEYAADPRDYGTDDPGKMAAIDTENFMASDGNLGIYSDDVQVVVLPMEV